jgi:hypothetical protein
MNKTAEFPQTIEEFAASEWVEWIRRYIYMFHLRELVEDTVQDVLTSMATKNYVSRWDPSKGGSFSNWIFTFVRNMCLIKKKKSSSRGGTAIETAKSLEFSFDEGSMIRNTLVCEEDELPIDHNLRMEELLTILGRSEYAASSSNTHEGKHYERDILTIFSLMVFDRLSAKQVAFVLDTTPQWIYLKLKKIRPLVREVFDIGL